MKSRTDEVSDRMHKLSKWTQQFIQAARNDLEHYKREVEEIAGEKETNVYMVRGLNDIPLPNDSVIRFRFGDNTNISIYVQQDMICVYGSAVISIFPKAANHCDIKVVK